MEEIVFRVGNKTDSKDLGGSISRELCKGKLVKVKSIGKIALNNSVKGIIVARSYLLSTGNRQLSISPYFETNNNEDETELTIITFELDLIL
jgi:stage V sporulation protein SpoVS